MNSRVPNARGAWVLAFDGTRRRIAALKAQSTGATKAWLRYLLIAAVACARDTTPTTILTSYLADAACQDCSISSVALGVIGNDSLMPTLDARVASDGAALVAVAPLQGPRTIGIFEFNGEERGQVPLPDGWQSISAIDFTTNGSLAIMSEQRSDLAFLSPSDKGSRVVSVPPNTHRFLVAGNSLIINAQLRTAEGLGFPLHLLSPSGQVTHSFGAKDETVVPHRENPWRRRLALSRSGAVWSADPDTYTLQLWSRAPVLLRQLQRQSSWWDSASTGSNPAQFASEKPKAELIAIWEDSTGLLWTQLKVASRTWGALAPEEIARRREAPFQLREYDEFFDTVIEVIDPTEGRVIGTARFPGAVGMLLRGNVFAKWEQRGPSAYVLRLTRLTLTRGAG